MTSSPDLWSIWYIDDEQNPRIIGLGRGQRVEIYSKSIAHLPRSTDLILLRDIGYIDDECRLREEEERTLVVKLLTGDIHPN